MDEKEIEKNKIAFVKRLRKVADMIEQGDTLEATFNTENLLTHQRHAAKPPSIEIYGVKYCLTLIPNPEILVEENHSD